MQTPLSHSQLDRTLYKYIGWARFFAEASISIEYLVYREVGTDNFWVTNDKMQYPVKVSFAVLERAARITNERGLKWESAM